MKYYELKSDKEYFLVLFFRHYSQNARGNRSYKIFSGSVYLFALVPKIFQQKVDSCLNVQLRVYFLNLI